MSVIVTEDAINMHAALQDREPDVNDLSREDARYLRALREAAERRSQARAETKARWLRLARTISIGILGGITTAVGTRLSGLLIGWLISCWHLMQLGWERLWR